MGWHILNFDNEIKVNLAKPTGRYHIKSYLKRNVTMTFSMTFISWQQNSIYKNSIAQRFNNVLPKLTGVWLKRILKPEKYFQEFLTLFDKEMEFKELSFQEFEMAFKWSKRNTAWGIHDLHASIILDIYDKLNTHF